MKRRLTNKLISFLGALLVGLVYLVVTVLNNSSQSEKLAPRFDADGNRLYQVAKVVDGDTIQVNIDGKQAKVRLIGINTPETVDPRRPVECFGKEASQRLKKLLEGNWVRLEADSSQDTVDRYGRLLRYVFTEQGENVNLAMIAGGYAYEYTYGQPYLYQREFKAAQIQAIEQHKGLWSPKTCNGEKQPKK